MKPSSASLKDGAWILLFLVRKKEKPRTHWKGTRLFPWGSKVLSLFASIISLFPSNRRSTLCCGNLSSLLAVWSDCFSTATSQHSKLSPTPSYPILDTWSEGAQGILQCERDQGKIVLNKPIAYTDFPLSKIQIWVQGSTSVQMGKILKIAMLPSEY